MNATVTRRMRGLLPLLAIAPWVLASCQSHFDQRDEAFGRATQRRLAGEFHQHAETLAMAEKSLGTPAGQPVPGGFSPWWADQVSGQLFADSKPATHAPEDLFASALANSAQIKVFSDIPLIRQTGIQEARGEFDTHLFVDTAYEYVDEPVGSTLTTGGPDRFKQWDYSLEGGVKKKLLTGADVTLSQKLGRTHNNSVFFVPERQSSAVLALTVVQPLLRGGGIEYNRSLIRIAKIDSEIARNEFIRQTESHLLQLSRAYWNLYLARATWVQKKKLADETGSLLGKLEKRKDIDAIEGERMRAKAALAKRRAELVRAEAAIKNAEDRIKALTNDPDLLAGPTAELIPGAAPSTAGMDVSLKDAATTAIENRPEIRQAFLQLKTAAVRKDMAKNELLPQLDLILSTSISGLDEAGCLFEGYDEEWEAHPGFLVGAKFDFPVENNAARARYRRRRLEIRQQLAQIQTTVDTVLLEVKIAAREMGAAYREMNSRYESLQAANEDLRVLSKRWESHAGADGKGAINYLQLLLEAQDRLAVAEQEFARAAVIYNVAMLNLQRAQGTLLKYENIAMVEGEDADGLPKMRLQPAAGGAAAPTGSSTLPPEPTTPVEATEPKVMEMPATQPAD